MKRNAVRPWKAAPTGQRHTEEHRAQGSQEHIQALETGIELPDDDLAQVCGGAGPLDNAINTIDGDIGVITLPAFAVFH